MATTIDFDDVTGGAGTSAPTNVSNQYSGQGVTFIDPAGPAGAVMGSALGLSGYSSPNVFFADQHQSSDAGDLEIKFSSGVSQVSLTSFLSNNYYLQYALYNASGVEISSGNSALETATGMAQTLTLTSAVPISSITLTSHPASSAGYYGSFTFDNLSFVNSAVPEPAAWALMMGGIGGIGSMARRRARALGGPAGRTV